MKKQLLNLTMLLVALLMGGGSALGADEETLKLDAEQTTVLRNLTYADAVSYDKTATSWNTTYARVSGGKLASQQDKDRNEVDTYFVITKFDLSSLPSGVTLTAATVSFNSKCTVSGKNSQLSIAKFGTNWEGTTATWNNTDKSITDIAALSYSGSTSTTEQVCDVRNILNEEIKNNNKAIGFAIYTKTAREQEITDIKLEIKYSSSEVAEYSYTVNAKCNEKILKEIESGKALATDNRVVYFPFLMNVGNVWYKTAETSYAVTIDKDTNRDIEYEAINNVVAFAEGESAAANSTYNEAYSSGRDGHVAAQNKTNRGIAMGTLPAGVYQMVVKVTDNPGRGVNLRDNSTEDQDNNTVAYTINSNGLNTVDFTLTKTTSLVVNGKNYLEKSNQSADFDYVYIVKTADVLSLSTSYTYSTYTPSSDVDLTNENGVEFYAAKANDKKVVLTQVEGTVKAGTGLLVKNTKKVASVTLATATDGKDVAGNALVGVTEDMTAEQLVANNAYILIDDNTFRKVGAGASDVLAKGKAYLKVDAAEAQARQIFISNPTAVNAVAEKTEQTENVIYNMQGMRVKNADASGLYIVNGKKYIKK